MTAPRKAPNLTIKLASALLRIKNPDGSYLIPEPHRSSGTAEEIAGCVQWDHGVLHAHGGGIEPQNLWPMLTADHREKSRPDTSKAAKAKRISADQEAFRARMLEKLRGEVGEIEAGKRRKAKIANGGFSKTLRKRMDGTVERREK